MAFFKQTLILVASVSTLEAQVIGPITIHNRNRGRPNLRNGPSYSSYPSARTTIVIHHDYHPTADSNTLTVKEDHDLPIFEQDFKFHDVDDDTLKSVKITELPEFGTLKLNYAFVHRNQDISIEDINSGKLRFIPASNEYGDDYAHLKFKVTDSSGMESVKDYTLTFNVTPCSDNPTADNKTLTFKEDHVLPILEQDFKFHDVDDDKLKSVKITELPEFGTLKLNYAFVHRNQDISIEDINSWKLRFIPASNEYGDNYAHLKFKVTDSSGMESFKDYTLTFNVTPCSDKPIGRSKTIKLEENDSYRIVEKDFGFENSADNTTLKSVKITATPKKGTLKNMGHDVEIDEVIRKKDLEELVFEPERDDSGNDYATVKFKVTDSANSTSDDEYTITFDVKAAEKDRYR